MIDPEVARLRRLRAEALLVREIARMLAGRAVRPERLLERAAGASWRIVRIVSGRLRGHPYVDYQSDAGLAVRLRNALWARAIAWIKRERPARAALESRLSELSRRLDDAVALSWSSEFSEALARAQHEIKGLLPPPAREAGNGAAELALRSAAARPAGNLARALEGDWPYLAF